MAGKLSDQAASEAVLIHALGAQLDTEGVKIFLGESLGIKRFGGFEPIKTS